MDSPDRVLDNLRDILGCSGLRDFQDLAKMRLDTLHGRIGAVNHRLSRHNVISICIGWLQTNVLQDPSSLLPIKNWCSALVDQRCNGEDVLHFWQYSLDHTWLYHRRNRQGPLEQMNRLYGEIKRYLYEDESSLDGKPMVSPSSNPRGALLGKTMDNYDEVPPRGEGAGQFVTAIGCAEKTTNLPSRPSEDEDGVSRHQTKTSGLDKTEALNERKHDLQDHTIKGLQKKGAQKEAAQTKGARKNFASPKAPAVPSLAKPLAKDICRRCHTAGHAFSNCPTINDPSWDPPPHPRYRRRPSFVSRGNSMRKLPLGKTAMELWQNSSDLIEFVSRAENEAPLVVIKLEESHGASDDSRAIEGI
ncbi:uncharacterized protein MAM_03874 [Metarhizium album ARSEF 1941]|uniref:Uncharacterized protein n=1 Tax=Metarhizium album (strain ARSEF 1941) TaxID=1081103 RepID=A0A0B2WVM1_METAS|nr:uncharacterized protein MAM_03874 [Metarhizium album ARSEF 1941]KHN98113.1 hypothetical protein MAM_03874 [Metarhizium album ARSEF 1941]